MLGASTEGITCGYFRRMVLMMAHHRLPCTGPTYGDFLRPSQILLLRRCSLHVPDFEEAVLRNLDADEKVAAGSTLSAVRRSL